MDMIDSSDAQSEHRRAINFIVAETSRPLAEVSHLYEQECLRLEKWARVKRYVPIFIYRHVIEQLADAPVPA